MIISLFNNFFLCLAYPGAPYGYPTPSPYGHPGDWRQAYPFGPTPLYLPQPQYPQFPTIQQAPAYIPYHLPPRRTEVQSVKDKPHMQTINTVVQKITQELKNILKKDFNKKMVENTAFKKFEMWWEEESTKENIKKEDVFVPIVVPTAKEPPPKENNINILLEANRENLYSNANLEMGLGLGLRATLPKMPSFRRKKIPSPVPEDEDSQKLSDNEEIVQNSDSESRFVSFLPLEVSHVIMFVTFLQRSRDQGAKIIVKL